MKPKLQKPFTGASHRDIGRDATLSFKTNIPRSSWDAGQDRKQRARETGEKSVGKSWASVLALWALGLFCALSALSQTTFASEPLAPKVSFTVPANGATGVAINAKIAVTFSEAMNPATITRGTFALKQDKPPRRKVIGTVSYTGVTATFAPQ
jgi:hypothetical protein